jgi:hypothetical protein
MPDDAVAARAGAPPLLRASRAAAEPLRSGARPRRRGRAIERHLAMDSMQFLPDDVVTEDPMRNSNKGQRRASGWR